MVENPYFQFPLCALSFGDTELDRLNSIIDLGLMQVGLKLYRGATTEQREQFVSSQRNCSKLPSDFRVKELWHVPLLYGADTLGITIGSCVSGLERYRKLEAYISEFEKRHGRDALLRIKKGWVFDARDGKGLSYRELSVLCAIYSVIGDKELCRVTRERIRQRALGYRSAAIMAAELPNRLDKQSPLTERQLRNTIERLHQNKFFARATFARRITYYSIRLDPEALRKKIVDNRTYARFFQATRRAQDAALTDEVRRKLAALSKPAATGIDSSVKKKPRRSGPPGPTPSPASTNVPSTTRSTLI